MSCLHTTTTSPHRSVLGRKGKAHLLPLARCTACTATTNRLANHQFARYLRRSHQPALAGAQSHRPYMTRWGGTTDRLIEARCQIARRTFLLDGPTQSFSKAVPGCR